MSRIPGQSVRDFEATHATTSSTNNSSRITLLYCKKLWGRMREHVLARYRNDRASQTLYTFASFQATHQGSSAVLPNEFLWQISKKFSCAASHTCPFLLLASEIAPSGTAMSETDGGRSVHKLSKARPPRPKRTWPNWLVHAAENEKVSVFRCRREARVLEMTS